MLDETGRSIDNNEQVEPDKIVTAVFPHTLHGRLVERVILFVQPKIQFKGEVYKLTWWGDGIAYYQPSA